MIIKRYEKKYYYKNYVAPIKKFDKVQVQVYVIWLYVSNFFSYL